VKLIAWSPVLAWLVALIGALMSLFYSAVLSQEPCSLCWYQRIALFPLAVQLGIAAYRSDRQFAIYAYPLCLFGFIAALYQAFLPLLPSMQKACGVHGDCAHQTPFLFGIPFPWISALGFILLTFLIRLMQRGS